MKAAQEGCGLIGRQEAGDVSGRSGPVLFGGCFRCQGVDPFKNFSVSNDLAATLLLIQRHRQTLLVTVALVADK
jgi:hypothetical protein